MSASSPPVVAPTLAGPRVELICLGPDGVGALSRRDLTTLAALTGARWPDASLDDLGDHLDSIQAALVARPEDAPWWTWGVVDRSAGQACGAVGLGGPPDNSGIVWVGYSLYRKARGRGLATEAVKTLVDWAFLQDPVRAVLASIAPQNLKSAAVAGRAGLRFHMRGAGSAMDVYRQTRGQWEEHRCR